MKKYTNKILIITLIAAAVLMVVFCTVEIRKAYHNGQIRKTEEFMIQPRETNSQRIIIDADTIQVINAETEIDE
jgi:hypothetical protein